MTLQVPSPMLYTEVTSGFSRRQSCTWVKAFDCPTNMDSPGEAFSRSTRFEAKLTLTPLALFALIDFSPGFPWTPGLKLGAIVWELPEDTFSKGLTRRLVIGPR